MARVRKLFCKSIFGDTQKTLEAIQRFINQDKQTPGDSVRSECVEENPASSINRVISSIADKNISVQIEKIIRDI